MNVTEKIADVVATTQYENLPTETIDLAKLVGRKNPIGVMVSLGSASSHVGFGSSAAPGKLISSAAAFGGEAELPTEFSATKMCMAASEV